MHFVKSPTDNLEKKWATTGLLENIQVDDVGQRQKDLAVLLENQAKYILNSHEDHNDEFLEFMLPLVRKVFGNTKWELTNDVEESELFRLKRLVPGDDLDTQVSFINKLAELMESIIWLRWDKPLVGPVPVKVRFDQDQEEYVFSGCVGEVGSVQNNNYGT